MLKRILKFFIPMKLRIVLKKAKAYILYFLKFFKAYMLYAFLYRKKQLCYISPFSTNANLYIDLMKKVLLKMNIMPVPEEYIRFADFIWYHWIENSYEKNPDILLQIKNYSTKKKKIIWNIHNKIPHETEKVEDVKRFMKTMAEIAYKIVVHSSESVELIKSLCGENQIILSKIILVPHPNYVDAYGAERINHVLQNDKLVLTFFGAVRKYKNIELLISIIKELNFDDIKLNIIGNFDSKHYGDYLGNLIENNNIKTDFRFIEDTEIPNITANSHIFVLPYNLESSLNSGTTMLAFSYGRTVVSSFTGTLADIKDKSLFFTYYYKDEIEHKEKLKEQIISIREKYKGNYNALLAIGGKCKEYVIEHNSLSKVAEQLTMILK